jgi:hypothetical protein
MRHCIWTGLAIAAMGLLTAPAEAGGHHGGHSTGHHASNHAHHSYHTTHGTRYSRGYYYRGHNHTHWTYTSWSPRYRTRFYWDPSAAAWYYWSAQGNAYYPVSSIDTVPPAVEQAPAQTIIIVNGPVTVVPAAPAGAGTVQPFVPPSR